MHHQSWNVAEPGGSIWNQGTWWQRQETASGGRFRVRLGSKSLEEESKSKGKEGRKDLK